MNSAIIADAAEISSAAMTLQGRRFATLIVEISIEKAKITKSEVRSSSERYQKGQPIRAN
eukprot:scaffold5498_cov86-Cylindrotheca_fusiformis.AAC.9